MTAVRSLEEARNRDQTPARVQPHDLAAEQAVLGAMLLSPHAIDTTTGILTADDYYQPSHGHIHHAAVHLWTHGQPVDPVTLSDELRRRGQLDDIGGPAALVTLQAATPGISAAPKYARIVANKARLRHLIAAAAHIAELGYSDPDDVDQAVDQAEQTIFDITARDNQPAVAALTDVLARATDALAQRVAGTALPGLRTGIDDLDQRIGGIQPGDVACIAGRPATGKTQLATHIAFAIAGNQPILYISAEMSEEQMGERLLAHLGNITLHDIRRGTTISATQRTNLQTAVDDASSRHLYLLSAAGPSVMSIRADARRLAARLHQPPVIIVDYLQLLSGPKAENRNNEVAKLSWGLKQIAMDLHTQVIYLSQLSREVERRADKRPVLSDLRDSGALEQDCSVVIGIYVDANYNPETKDHGIAELIVLKNRMGQMGTVRVGYEASTGRYRPLARHVDRTDPGPKYTPPPDDQERF